MSHVIWVINIIKMKRLIPYLISAILFLGFIQSYAQNNVPENKPQDTEETEKKSKKGILLVSVGSNISSFLTEYGGWQLGYRIGVTFNIKVSKDVFVTPPFAYTRINAFRKNAEEEFYSYDNVGESYQEFYIYKLFIDQKISLAFLEFPALLCYRFYQTNRYGVSITLGPGFALAVKDFSKWPTVTITNEIIGTHNGEVFDIVDGNDPYRYLKDSGYDLNAGIRFNLSWFYLDMMYTYYPYTINEIENFNAISLIFSVDLEQ